VEQTILSKYDLNSQGYEQFPFLDLNNLYMVGGSAVDPALLQGKSWQQIAGTLSDPANELAREIIGNANYLTAGICRMTGDQPATVCSGATIPSLESQLGSS
jgi:hypothetical protein